jgi:GDP-mannose 6-dehydrogenase
MIGMGPVGTVSGLCFAKSGFSVIGVDINPARVQAFADGEAPFIEPQVNELLKECQTRQLFTVTDDATSAIQHSEIIMIAVGTPTPEETGVPDLSFLEAVAKTIGTAIKNVAHAPIIVVRSTVPPYTMRHRLAPLIAEHSGKEAGVGFHIAANPEFLREGRAIADFFHTGRVVIGADDAATFEKIAALYHEVEGEVLHVSLESAEFAKYVDNTWHAVKVAFANEIARVVTGFGGNPEETAAIFLKDKQLNISPYYLRPGFAFGGSCLPKDTRGILALARQHNVDLPLIAGVLPSNETHIDAGVAKVMSYAPKRVGLLGCAFKEHVDDLRESPALMVASKLMAKAVEVTAHDMAFDAGEHLALPRTNACLHTAELEDVITQSDVLVLMHNLPDYRTRAAASGKTLVDLTTIP